MAPRRRSKGRTTSTREGLGQHFLRSPELCRRLVETAGLEATDTVVEIGPGAGALTGLLAERAGRVVAVELDPAYVRALRARLAPDGARRPRAAGRVEVVHGDFLRWPLPRHPYRVFANPPFAHSAAIVRRLTEHGPPPDDAWLVLEDGAARRFAGAPFGPETLRSLLLKPEWHVELRAELSPGAFSPPARDRCALLWLARRARPIVASDARRLWSDFVASAFGRRGNTVDAGLRGLLTPEQLRRCARSLRFDPRDPPSALGFEQWLGLFRCFEARASAGARRRVAGALDRLPR